MKFLRTARVAALACAPLLAVACGGAKANTPLENGAAPATSASATPDAPATTTDLPATGASGTPLEKVAPATTSTPAASASATPPSDAPKGKASEPGRSVADIQAAVQAKRAEARACYDAGVAKNPAIAEGDLVVNFYLAADGAVKNLEVDAQKSQITDAAVGACVTGILGKLSFPKSAKGFETRASYPFNFKKKASQLPH